MTPLKVRRKGLQKRLCRLEDCQTFLGRFHFALPAVDGLDLGEEIHTRDQLRGDQFCANLSRDLDGGEGHEDQ